MALHDLNENYPQMFEARVEEERERELDRITQIIREAGDLVANVNLQNEKTASSNPDLTELQRQLERGGETVIQGPSLASRIRNARDL